jgi:dTMP kinase
MLIAVEGIDGCGKTTLVARLAAELRDRGRTVVVVRRYMLDEITALWWRLVDLDLVDQRGTAQLAAADYATGLQRIIVPALDAGSVVIADKYAYSHRVYFTLRGMGPAELDALFSNMLEPDHVLWPRMDAPAAPERLGLTDGKPDLLESGLDHRLGLSIGAAFARYGLGGAPAELRERHFLEHHARTDELFAAWLPSACTHELDAQLDRDALARAALRAIDADGDRRARAATARELVEG